MKPMKQTLIEMLNDSDFAAEYLNTVLAEGNPRLLLAALRDVAEARGGMRKVARTTRLHRGNLHKMLSKSGNPEVVTLVRLLRVFGLRLAIAPYRKKSRGGWKKAA